MMTLNSSALTPLWQALQDARLVRDLDVQLAQLLARWEPNAAVLLAAAMTSQELGRGHVCFALSSWSERLTQWQPLFPEAWADLSTISVATLMTLLERSQLVRLVSDPTELDEQAGQPLTLFAGRLYLSRYFRFEQRVANWLQQASAASPVVASSALSEPLQQLFAPQETIDWQAVAVATASDGRFTLISGGPGTGKTTTVTKLLALLVAQSEQPLLIRLAAPTGKAAARLTESISGAKVKLAGLVNDDWLAGIPTQASTLHRLLGVIPGQPEFQHNAQNPLPLDVLVVDEASMIDLPMMARLLAALPPQARLILLGDKDQLASVEAGAVLGDICQFVAQGISQRQAEQLQQYTGYALQSYVRTTGHPLRDRLCLLRKSWRFAAGSGIGQLAEAVNDGDAKAAQALWTQEHPDIRLHADEQRLDKAVRLAAQGYHTYLDLLQQPVQADNAPALLTAFNQVRLLCALHEGLWGINGLNQAIGQRLQAQGKLQMSGEWFAGRPVMITENDYGLGLYNGDIGVTAHDGERLRVWFMLPDGKAHGFLPSRLPAHDTAWAMTVHKSQGSEFSHTLLVLPPEANPLLTRELLYTGITRAREQLDLFATPEVLTLMVRKPTERYSGLVTMLETMQTLYEAE
ncbi:exodeoxyribonuclease V subunit alpha [Tolumonas lignilytica]|uniref:exodeoxyribonuclease V subunit alpha n=1 Tax=Tolumonas lignilytica TaxID=1283284 RepID=UPI0004AE4FF0|nr:exodeoxyribonuclease V subunit alpha [Tolumonas lignilytica]